jgi:hypothetical protein
MFHGCLPHPTGILSCVSITTHGPMFSVRELVPIIAIRTRP